MIPKIFMAFESSCDETAIAILDSEKNILAQQIFSQIDLHQIYGGVVPEIAARAHLEKIEILTKTALNHAKIKLENIDAIAVTSGPGLMGGLLVGVNFANSLAQILEIPLYPINHLEGHALSVRLTENITFPYLLLLVSGGHCQILAIEAVGCYHIYGETLDDAAGETFDKAANLLGLPYPGGPAIEKAAKTGLADSSLLPRPLIGKAGCDFSFSGLKSAFRRKILNETTLDNPKIAYYAASLQATIADIFIDRLKNAFTLFRKQYHKTEISCALVGGVASNQMIRNALAHFCRTNHAQLICPPVEFCTDNAAMIAWAAIEHYQAGDIPASINIRPAWPLSECNLNVSSH